MGSKMLIDASQREETRVVVARGNRIEEFDFESASRKPLKGNIYLAKVTRVEPSLQAAFVEYGGNRHGFLAFAEIHPDYYQIPIADRQALIREQEEEDAEYDEENGNGHQAGGSSSESTELDHHDEPHEHAEGSDEPAALAADDMPSLASEPLEHADSHDEAPSGGDGQASGEVVSIDEDSESRKVESIGAEDALEEVPQRTRRPRRRVYKIQEVIKRRQILLVQVVKEERGNKGAALTTYLSLAGRYCVLMPNTARGGGISRKITDAGDRRRLKEVARDVEVPQGMGLIVRTAGAQRTRPEIKRDFDYLLRLWESVRDLTLQSQAPCLVYEEGSLIKRSIRDLYTKDVDEVVVAGEEAYREAKDFMKMLMPSHAKNVKLYNEPKPLFQRHQIETHLDALFSPTVTLPSGGYIVINQTEALVSIDINSGKATREHSIEDTAYKTNLEACDEIGRQLRLRDLAGLVVIDFIDMEENRNNRSVERRIKEALKNDRARIQVGRISHFGLLEMSRQRLRPGLIEGTFRTCPHCEGRGMVRSVPSCGLGVLRAVEESLQKRAENLNVTCAREVASYLLNEKRDSLLAIEQTYGVTVFIIASVHDMKGMQSTIERAPDRENAPRRITSAPVKMDSAFSTEPESDGEIVEDEAVDEEAETETSGEGERVARNGNGEGDQRDGGRKRRRRGRRGGRRPDRDREGHESTSEAGENPNTDAVAPDAETDRGSDGDAPERRPRNGRRDRDSNPEVAQDGEASADAEANADGEKSERPKRDRFGRGRGRRGEKADRGDRGGRRERGDRPERSERSEEAAPSFDAAVEAPRAAAQPIFIPEAIAEPEPRKWQPPAPTIAAEPAEKKGGWWAKRKT